MKFYCVTYRDESAPEGIGFDIFRSKAAAKSCAAEIRRICRKQARDLQAQVEGKELDYSPSIVDEEYTDIEVVEIPEGLTPKEMIFWALKWQVVC